MEMYSVGCHLSMYAWRTRSIGQDLHDAQKKLDTRAIQKCFALPARDLPPFTRGSNNRNEQISSNREGGLSKYLRRDSSKNSMAQVEVVELLDDSDDDDDLDNNQATIDLCESSDDEAECKISLHHCPKPSSRSSFQDNDDSSEDVLLKATGGPVFSSSAKKQQKRNPYSSAHSAAALAPISQEEETGPSLSARHPITPGQSCTPRMLAYKNDLLLGGGPVCSWAKKSTALQASNPYRTAVANTAPVSQEENPTLSSSASCRQNTQGQSHARKTLMSNIDSSDDDADVLLSKDPIFSARASGARQPKTSQSTASQDDDPETTPRNVSTPTTLSRTTTAPRPFSYPTLPSRSYADQRARWALQFWKSGRSRTTRAYNRPKLEAAAKRVVRLALARSPIRSVEEFVYMKQGSNATTCNNRSAVAELKQELDGCIVATTPVTCASPNRRYYTIVEACLVALMMHVKNSSSPASGNNNSKDLCWMPLSQLIPAIDGLLRPECPGRLTRRHERDLGAAYYLQGSTRSMEFMQVTKLENDYIKRRSVQKVVHYELLPEGYAMAKEIQNRVFPAPPGYYRTSRIWRHDQVLDKFKGICLAVDKREGGSRSGVLHEFCSKLDAKRVPYFVGTLDIGDYAFFTTRKNDDDDDDALNYLCPILVERKSVQDVAQSIHDGRWKRQKRRMYHGQYVFGYDNCRMVFIIEGNENKQLVSGGYIAARHFDVDKERLHTEISNLQQEGFAVIQTPSRENTMFELARWAERIATEIKEGTLKAEYTYEQFKQQCARVGPNVDFSRLAKDHVRQMREAASKPSAAYEDSVDSDIEILVESVGLNGSSAKNRKVPASSPERDFLPRKKPKIDTDSEEADDGYAAKSSKELQEACKAAGLAKSGTRADLISRLKGPRPPKLWLARKRKGEWVPERHNVGGSACLVALYLHERDEAGPNDPGMTRDELYVKAEDLSITKNPFSGGTTQTGPYHYNGMSGFDKNTLKGDPALVVKKKGRYKLTRSCEIAGYGIAQAIHNWNHEYGNCPCGDPS